MFFFQYELTKSIHSLLWLAAMEINLFTFVFVFFPDDGRSDIDNSLVVSMEINGIMYQGVLFAHNPRRMWNFINWTQIWKNLKENNHSDLFNAGLVFWPLTQKGCPQILWSIGVDSCTYHCGCHYQRVSLLSKNAILVFKNCANVMLQIIHFETIQRIFIYLFPRDIPTCSPYFVKHVWMGYHRLRIYSHNHQVLFI